MVPPAHARWLEQNLPRCTLRIEPGEGLLTLSLNRIRDVLADLVGAAGFDRESSGPSQL